MASTSFKCERFARSHQFLPSRSSRLRVNPFKRRKSDTQGRVESETSKLFGGVLQKVTQYSYNDEDVLVGVDSVVTAGGDSESLHSSYALDSENRVIGINTHGPSFSYGYDALGRVTTVQGPGGKGSLKSKAN